MTNASSAPSRPVLIAAGGTGGHLAPARALAEELGRRGAPVELVTDERGGRFDEGFPARAVHEVPAATPVGRSPVRALSALITLARGVVRARALIRAAKPAVVVGFGGYPTIPPLIAARLAGVPSMIHDQNAVIGRANRLLARLVDAVATAVERPANANPSILAKAVMTGNPVRDAVVAARDVPYAPFRSGEPLHLLVFGGSQGARVFSELVPEALKRLPGELRQRVSLVQQCRIEDIEAVRSAYADFGLDAELAPFFADMPERMAQAQLVIARSGASTVSEIAAIGRPAILVPLPHAIDNDQRENARALQSAGGAWMREQHTLDADTLSGDIKDLMEHSERLTQAAAAARAAGRPKAVLALADLALDLARRHTA